MAIGLLFGACDDDGSCSSTESGSELSGGSGGLFNTGGTGTAAGTGGMGFGGSGAGGSTPVDMYPELWYCVDQLLVLITLSASDGSVESIESSTISLTLDSGQSAITMLEDGSLLGSRLSQTDDQSHLFHIPDPPRDGSDVDPVPLGVMPGGIMLEGLYTDCEGRVYGMDTGVDDTSADGNRLLRFTGDVTAGDFTFVVVSDLATADVADIDDMGPGIDTDGQITDNPGYAIDSCDIYDFNYETGFGTLIASGGTWGIHALGGPLFTDDVSRLYVLSMDAELFEVDPVSFVVSGVLGTGPAVTTGLPGWTGLTGPLTDCVSGFVD